jgi:hypothetical protein
MSGEARMPRKLPIHHPQRVDSVLDLTNLLPTWAPAEQTSASGQNCISDHALG